VLLWAAFAPVTAYVIGSITQAFVMLAGIAGDPDDVDAWSVAYVLAFFLAAPGSASSRSRTHDAPGSALASRCWRLRSPVLLGTVLVILPAILKAAGLLSG
jgi:hypothetical protein